MSDLLSHLLTAFALIFVIEGLLYAIFPTHIQKMMAMASDFPPEKFRSFGAAMVALGRIASLVLSKAFRLVRAVDHSDVNSYSIASLKIPLNKERHLKCIH